MQLLDNLSGGEEHSLYGKSQSVFPAESTSGLSSNFQVEAGRYRLSRRKQILAEHFDAPFDDDWEPRYNIAPNQPVPVVRQHPKEPVRQFSTMKWGLIPHWAKDLSIVAGTINAKSETAATKPAFRDPLRFRRCLTPADGFYRVEAIGKQQTAVLL